MTTFLFSNNMKPNANLVDSDEFKLLVNILKSGQELNSAQIHQIIMGAITYMLIQDHRIAELEARIERIDPTLN